MQRVGTAIDSNEIARFTGSFTLGKQSRAKYLNLIDKDMLDQLQTVRFFRQRTEQGDSLAMYIPLHGNRRMYWQGAVRQDGLLTE